MNAQEFNNCVDQYSDGVYRFIVKNIGNEADAEDIVQIAFEKLWVNRDKVEAEKAKSYLFTVAYHQMIDQIRKDKNKSTTDNLEEVKAQVQHNHNAELKQILLSAINQLNPTQKSLVLLKDYEGYSYQEIAEITDLSVDQVKVYIFRARRFLKQYIGNMEVLI